MGMKQNSPQALYSYWNQVRAGRQAPQRLEIEPSQIAGILSETFMLERIDAATYQFRLAGTRLCEQFGRELRGTNFLDGWDADGRRTLQGLLVAVCDQAAGLSLTLEGATNGRQWLIKEGMTAVPVPPNDRATMQKAAATVVDNWLKRLKPDGRKIYDQAKAMIDEYNAAKK